MIPKCKCKSMNTIFSFVCLLMVRNHCIGKNINGN